ncbi:MAG TPA: hypothetical protein VGO57_13510, partial [Verrucomicrobiae bacterium]
QKNSGGSGDRIPTIDVLCKLLAQHAVNYGISLANFEFAIKRLFPHVANDEKSKLVSLKSWSQHSLHCPPIFHPTGGG